MNGPVAGDTIHPFKGGRANSHIEVTFATFLIPRVSTVALAVINNLQLAWRKGRFQPSMNFLCHGHFFVFSLFYLPTVRLNSAP